MIRTLALAALCVLPVLSAAPAAFASEASVQDIRKEADDLARALKGYTAEQSEQAVERARESVRKLDRRIEELEDDIRASVAKRRDTERAALRRFVDDLRGKRIEVAERIGELRGGSKEAWNELKTGFLRSYTALRESYERAVLEVEQPADGEADAN